MKNNRQAIERWASEAILKRHTDVKIEGRIVACGWMLGLLTPTRTHLRRLADNADTEAELRFLCGDDFHHRFFRGVADTLGMLRTCYLGLPEPPTVRRAPSSMARLTMERLQLRRTRMGAKEKEKLRDDLRYAPAWMRPFSLELMLDVLSPCHRGLHAPWADGEKN